MYQSWRSQLVDVPIVNVELAVSMPANYLTSLSNIKDCAACSVITK